MAVIQTNVKGILDSERWLIAKANIQPNYLNIDAIPRLIELLTYGRASTWKEACKRAEELDVVLVPYECERGMETTREVIKSIQPGQSIAIFIGPEGGFYPEEIEGICPTNQGEGFSAELEEKSYRISLGRRILRTETAGLAILSMLIFCLDE